MYPWVHSFVNLDGWTPSHIGTGGFIAGYPVGTFYTGATSASRALAYSSSIFLSGGGGLETYFKTRVSPRDALAHQNSFMLVGFIDTPTSPLATAVQVSFRFFNGDIFVCCANGATGTLIDTGVNYSQFGSYDLSFFYRTGAVDFVVDNLTGNPITTTITTDVPNNQAAIPTMYLSNSAAQDKQMWLYPMIIMQGK